MFFGKSASRIRLSMTAAVPIKSAFPPGVTRIIWKAGAFHVIFNIAADIRMIIEK